MKSLVNAKGFIDQILFSQFYFCSLFLIAMSQKSHNQNPAIMEEEWKLATGVPCFNTLLVVYLLKAFFGNYFNASSYLGLRIRWSLDL